MELKEIQNLIKFVAKSGVSEVKLEMGDVKITIRTGEEGKGDKAYIQELPNIVPTEQPIVTATPVTPEEPAAPAEDESKFVTIKSPIIGTFYRKPSPDKPVFKEVGDIV